MKLEKAIDRNKELKGELLREGRLEKANAVQLGIEAMKEVKRARNGDPALDGELLPGETKD